MESIPDNVNLSNLYIFNMAGKFFITTLYEKLPCVNLRQLISSKNWYCLCS